MLSFILSVFVLMEGFVIWNLLKKVESYEEKIDEYENHIINFQKYYKQITEAIQYSDIQLKKVDHRGSFKSDDEIGYFFKMIQDLQLLLNSFDHTKPNLLPPDELPKEPFKVG